MQVICAPLGWLMRAAYNLTGNYGLAVILFTLMTKVILLPVSLWVHVNGIKMVKLEPAVNRLKVKYFGDPDKIADEQGSFDIADVCNRSVDKLIFRHPHVYHPSQIGAEHPKPLPYVTTEEDTSDKDGEQLKKATNVEQVLDNWERLKQKEKQFNERSRDMETD